MRNFTTATYRVGSVGTVGLFATAWRLFLFIFNSSVTKKSSQQVENTSTWTYSFLYVDFATSAGAYRVITVRSLPFFSAGKTKEIEMPQDKNLASPLESSPAYPVVSIRGLTFPIVGPK